MEATPLRRVHPRLGESIDPAQALAALRECLPGLPDGERQALALVALARRPRAAAAAELGVDSEELARRLAVARKALRRTLGPLPADGLCERAERLISDRLDGALQAAAVPRLDSHLSRCERCVEHERLLLEAQGRLIESIAAALSPPPEPEPVARPELRVVEPEPARPSISRRELVGWYATWAMAALAVVAVVLLGAAGAI